MVDERRWKAAQRRWKAAQRRNPRDREMGAALASGMRVRLSHAVSYSEDSVRLARKHQRSLGPTSRPLDLDLSTSSDSCPASTLSPKLTGMPRRNAYRACAGAKIHDARARFCEPSSATSVATRPRPSCSPDCRRAAGDSRQRLQRRSVQFALSFARCRGWVHRKSCQGHPPNLRVVLRDPVRWTRADEPAQLRVLRGVCRLVSDAHGGNVCGHSCSRRMQRRGERGRLTREAVVGASHGRVLCAARLDTVRGSPAS